MTDILLCFTLILLVYFVMRAHLLGRALRDAAGQLKEIQSDFTQNRVLHLAVPEKDLEALMSAVNDTLYEIRSERTQYAKRERDFQSQIEAISHDLRTPLTIILGYLKLLKKQTETGFSGITDEQQEMLNTTIRKAEAMEHLIAQFYDYSRLNAGDYEMTLETIDIGRVLREVFVDNCLILEKENLEVDTSFPNHPVWIKGNYDALERIFVNLLQNTGRYARRHVKLGIEEKGDQVLVLFENDTDKLSEQDIPNLFERFYRKDLSRNQGGSGLGLTIAKELAEEMMGSLEAGLADRTSALESADNCITIRFTLLFPAQGSAHSNAASPLEVR